VPPFQARQFHAALREQGVASRLLVYPLQTHPIAAPAMDGDYHINTARWFADNDPALVHCRL
jgi:dipeptidyl aminopeptidase/acylaminoacyl peptidase